MGRRDDFTVSDDDGSDGDFIHAPGIDGEVES
jgi:hypothetical protein